MNGGQITLIVMMAISWTITLVKHGTPRDDHNIGWFTVSLAIQIAILWWGGFWK